MAVKMIVLGCGRVGSAIARDLHQSGVAVTVADYSEKALDKIQSFGIQAVKADLRDAQVITNLIADFDLVIGAVPGWMGFETLKTVIEAGKNIVDISFCEEDPFRLDALAKEKGVTAVVDCGVAPGLSNMLLGRLVEEFDSISDFTCLVGGLPEVRKQPWEYMAPYSPVDVLEMYTRPARLRRNGENITMEALTEHEIINFPGVGPLEAFNTDGLRTVLEVPGIPNLKEKTLRYPGHMDKIILFRDSGFFSNEAVTVGEQTIVPMELTSQLLFEQWQQGEKDRDLTAMRISVDGIKDGERTSLNYDMLDRYDEHGIASMSRVTGYPCTAVAHLVQAGTYAAAGISPPEYVGKDKDCFDAVLAHLKSRGVGFNITPFNPEN